MSASDTCEIDRWKNQNHFQVWKYVSRYIMESLSAIYI